MAAVLAAAMSSLDSGINAISTVSVIDLMKPHIAKKRDDRYYLIAARLIAGVVTVLIILGAIIFSNIEKESMNDVSLIVTSIFGGCLMGLFILGFFSNRVDGQSATLAMSIAILLNIYIGLGFLGLLPKALILNIHTYWVAAFVNGTFIVLAYTISRIRNVRPANLEGLTVWNSKK
jgi:SSS family solute:Na+ symporter